MSDHDHDVMDVYRAAREEHRHYDLERELENARAINREQSERIGELLARVSALEDGLRKLWNHISNMPGGI